jgi:hypothetical protein
MTWHQCPNPACEMFTYAEKPPAKCAHCLNEWRINLISWLARMFCVRYGCHYSTKHVHDDVLHGSGRRVA